MDIDTDNNRPDLRPLIARLREIKKKCASMGSRNEEFPLMQERLSSIIKRLEAGEEPSGEPLAYRAIARELFPVAHLFESVGFMSVGKEIAHVEKTLQELAPEAPVPDAPAAGGATQHTISQPPAAADRAGVSQETDGEGSDHHVPWPIIGGLVVLLVATMIAAMMILEVGPFRVEPTVRATPPRKPVETVPTPAPAPTAVPEPPEERRGRQTLWRTRSPRRGSRSITATTWGPSTTFRQQR